MTMAYTEWDHRSDTIVAGVKQRILASSDWAHLQLTTGTAATTLASGASIGATSISTAASIPSGSYIVIGNGAANPEVRLSTGVTGSGPYTVSWTSAEPLTKTYSSGAAVGVGSYVKATTTRGAQMVVDLAASAPNTQTMTINAYQSHNGTTAGASVTRYLSWKRFGGAATDILHPRVSAGKDWLYLDIEGPRGGETNADNSTNGSFRQMFYLGDLAPYYADDTVPAVVLIGGMTGGTGDTHTTVHVSRNRADTASWVTAYLRTLAYPQYAINQTSGNMPAVSKEGDFVQAPCVILELGDGLRGRVNYLHHGGFNFAIDATDPAPPQNGQTMTYGAYTYTVFSPFRTDGNNSNSYGIGVVGNGNSSYTFSPLVWVPTAAYP
jgi:hypothetical protein